MKKSINELRKEIDCADDDLLKALAHRFSVIREIGKVKREQNIKPLDEKRWQEVLNNIIETSKKYNIPESLITSIYEEIHKAALKVEQFDE